VYCNFFYFENLPFFYAIPFFLNKHEFPVKLWLELLNHQPLIDKIEFADQISQKMSNHLSAKARQIPKAVLLFYSIWFYQFHSTILCIYCLVGNSTKIELILLSIFCFFSRRLMLRHLLKKENQTAAKQAHSLSREIRENLEKLL